MKLWHRFKAWQLGWQIRRQHRELAKFVRRSAYEISAWRQDISFLEMQMESHLARINGRSSAPEPVAVEEGKVVAMEKAAAA